MRLSWIRNIFLFSTVVVLASSCSQPEYSKDEPLIPEKRPAVYISGQNNFLYAISPVTGERIWERFFGVNTILQEPIILGDYALVNSNKGIVRLNADNGTVVDTIYQIDATTNVQGIISGVGDLIYTSTNVGSFIAYNYVKKAAAWSVVTGMSGVVKSPGSFYGKLFIVNIDDKIYAMNKDQGAEVTWVYSTAGPINNPVIAPPNMYVLDKSGILHSVDLESGIEGWNYVTGAPTVGSPVVYGGNIIYGSDNNNLYCIDSIAHAPRWVFNTKERVKGSAYGYEQVVYFGSYDHYIYGVNIITGELKWKYQTSTLIQSSPIAYQGIVYMPSFDQYLYAFDTSGALKWKFNANAPIEMSPVLNNLDKKVVYPAPSGLSLQ